MIVENVLCAAKKNQCFKAVVHLNVGVVFDKNEKQTGKKVNAFR